MTFFIKKTALLGFLALFSSGNLLAQNACQCPVLSVKDVKGLYESGQTYDLYRGYIPHTERKVTKKARESIASVIPQSATAGTNGSCICQYLVQDKHGNKIDQLGLEKL